MNALPSWPIRPGDRVLVRAPQLFGPIAGCISGTSTGRPGQRHGLAVRGDPRRRHDAERDARQHPPSGQTRLPTSTSQRGRGRRRRDDGAWCARWGSCSNRWSCGTGSSRSCWKRRWARSGLIGSRKQPTRSPALKDHQRCQLGLPGDDGALHRAAGYGRPAIAEPWRLSDIPERGSRRSGGSRKPTSAI